MNRYQFILIFAAGFILATAGLLVFYLWQRRARWKLVCVKGDFTTEHHLPEVLPVPSSQEKRVAAGDFSFEEAIAWLQQFVASRHRHPLTEQFRLALRKVECYKQLAEKMGRGRWSEVDQIATRLAELDPLDPSAALARGRAMRQLGHLASAIRFYQQALQLQPTHSVALPEFAATCRALGQPDRFQHALDVARHQLGETHPLTIESRVQLGELVRVFADPTDPATIAHIPREQYIRNVRSRLEEMEPDLTAAVPLAHSMLEEGMPELAQLVLERCEESFGDEPELLVVRGMVQHYERKLLAAERSLSTALAQAESAAARIELAGVLLDRSHETKAADGRRQLERQAQQQLRLAIEREPNNLEAVGLLADSFQAADPSTVIRELERLAEAYPQAWAPWRVLGDAYAVQQQPPEAIAAYQTGLSRRQVDAIYLPYLALLAELNRRTEFLKLAADIPNLPLRDPMLRWRVAQGYCEARKLPEARELLQGLLDDSDATPMLRQRARDILQRLELKP